MSAAKFALVALFFMHLRYDSRTLALLFGAALLLAVGLGVALVTLNGRSSCSAAEGGVTRSPLPGSVASTDVLARRRRLAAGVYVALARRVSPRPGVR